MLALLALAASALSACAPTPEPTPTATAAFASEEEAFAAAEEVYRDYNDAGGDGPQAANDYLTGNALEANLTTIRYLEQNDLKLAGSSTITSFNGFDASVTTQTPRVEAVVCLNLDTVRVLDSDGNDVTPPDRESVARLSVTFVGKASHLLISSSVNEDASEC